MGKLIIQKPAAFDAPRLRKDLAQAGRVYAQPKLMGLHLRWNGLRLCLAKGEEATGLPHLAAELLRLLPGVDLEGEAYWHGVSDEKVSGMARRGADNLHPDHEKVGFWIFDKVDGQDQYLRLAALEAIKPKIAAARHLHLVEAVRCTTPATVYELLSSWLADGFEGAVLRHPLGLWKTGYSAALQKIKPGGRDTYRVVDVLGCGGKLDGLLVEGQGGARMVVRALPFSDRQRREMIKAPEALAGRRVEVRYTEAAGGQPLASAVVRLLDPAPGEAVPQ